MVQGLKKIYQKAGFNSTIAYTILTRIVQSIGGIITLFLITYFLTKNEQGYFYTFLSILSIRLFFELGLTSVLTQYVAHEFAHLHWKNKFELTGDQYYQSRLASIIQLSFKWFFLTSALLFIVLFIVGNFFFSRYNDALNVEWQLPWLIISIATSVMLLLDLFFALMEGLGKIEHITKLRLIQQSINLILVALLLVGGLKLFANALALLISSIAIILFSFASGYFRILKSIWQTEITCSVNYRKEILPFQLRIAIGNMSNFFIFQLLNPVLFATQGAVAAGQMGATQTFLGGITAISSSWISTKIPLFSHLVAKRKFNQLNLLFKKNLFISSVVCVIGLIVFNIGLFWLDKYYPNLRLRFLGFIPVLFLSLTQLAGVVGSAQGYYLRSFKKDPFFISAVVIGVFTGLSTFIAGKYFGTTGITAGCLLINGVIGLTWGTIIFVKKRAEFTR